MKVSRVLAAPFPLARLFAGSKACRLPAEALMPGMTSVWPEPNTTVTTLSQTFCAHRLLPVIEQEEYDNHGLRPEPFFHAATPAVNRLQQKKKEEDDLFRS